MAKSFDAGSVIVVALTAALFAVALFVKGFTHDLLLEAGVLLVSIKLILMTPKSQSNYRDVKKDLAEIKEMLKGG
jgi:hypothetical protein